jgi:cell division protein FtsI/penicillin-binding protein 2
MSHKTYRGTEFNMSAFADANGHVPALGNSSRNARGDIIDRNGKIIATAQQVNAVYNNKNPKAVTKVSINKDTNDRLAGQTPRAATAAKPQTVKVADKNPADIIVSKKTIRLESGEEKTEITYADGSVEIV